jgi:hypothetical protein
VATPLAVLAVLMAMPAAARAEPATVDAAYAAQAAAHPGLVTRVVYGESRGGSDLTAYRVGNSGPAVLYVAAQDGDHALAAGVQQRLYEYVLDHPVARAQLWFVPLADPDGASSGVAFDRNWPDHWGFDDEGSSAATRGPQAVSEPEVAALGELIDDVRPARLLDFQEGALGRIVYPESWQAQTPSTDVPAFEALADAAGYPSGPAGELATANGTLIDTVHRQHGTLAFAVHVPAGADELVEFGKVREFALGLTGADDGGPDFVPHEFSLSYGRPQTVEVNARRSLGAVRVHWRVSGPERSAPLQEYKGGERYGAPGAIYHRLRGQVGGFGAGDSVQVWFEGGGRRSDAFTFTAVGAEPGRVLVLAAEDYSGTHPRPVHAGPEYLSAYTDALRGLGISYDVYDIDARGRTAPDALGVLSHYDTVVWYTGDDIFVRDPDQPGSTGTSRTFGETILAARDYLNDGGKLLASGQQALMGAWAQLIYDPVAGLCPYNNLRGLPTDGRCVPVSDDFMQYWLGAWRNGPADASQPLRAGSIAFGLENQFAPTRYLAAPGATRYAGFDRPAEFRPVTGPKYAVAASRDESYQRLTRQIDLSGATAGSLRFKLSYDVDPGYDYVFVEAREAGGSDWTTLPDLNGHTSTDTGDACPEGWGALHPHLAHYQDPVTCAATKWHAATGDSRGYQDWEIDLSAWAGKQVEVSITYVQDWATGGLGVYVDDAVTVVDGTVIETQSFEAGLGAWTAAGGWAAQADAGIVDGLGIATGRSILWGFGLEGVAGADTRQRLLGDALAKLLPKQDEPVDPPPPVPPPPPPVVPEPPKKVALPELVVGRTVTVDRRGRAKVRVHCEAKCTGVVKFTRGKRAFARATYRRSGRVTLRLNAAGRRATKLRLKLYRGSGRRARLVDTATVRLRRA